MRRQFKYRHLTDTIIILEEGEFLRCPRCGMFGIFANATIVRLARKARSLTYET
jgi:uncharacterized C2H2 Zn-finger protein